METKFGFNKMSVAEFQQWIKGLKVSRTILKVQQHHTYSPSYAQFKNDNHFAVQKGMKDYHVVHNGWNDIGQHFTIFPDGTILTGRSIEVSPACITGQNANAICIENLGNFDINGDVMNPAQKEAIIAVTAALCSRFNIPVTTIGIVYHHWFNLSTGERNNGTKNNKSCPGTNFFGGNKVQDCETHFLPLVKAKVSGPSTGATNPVIIKYVAVTATTLNVRTAANASAPKAAGIEAATFGGILRIYEQDGDWLKISGNQSNWVNGKYTVPVEKAIVDTDALNVRSGADATYPKTGKLTKGEEIFISEEKNGWCKISMDDKWVSKKYLKF